MQTTKFDIRLFLADQELQSVLEDIPHCEDCEQVITSTQLFSASDVARADLVICDDALVAAPVLRKACPARTIIILCTKHTKTPDARPELYNLVDEIWVQPLSPAYARARFIKNLQILKQQKNLPLNHDTGPANSEPLPDLPQPTDDLQLEAEEHYLTQRAFTDSITQNAVATFVLNLTSNTVLETRGDIVPVEEHGTVDALFEIIKSHIPAPLPQDSPNPARPDPLITAFYDREQLLHAFTKGLSSPSISHLWGATVQQASWVRVTASIIKTSDTQAVKAFLQLTDIESEKIVESSYSAAFSRENDSISCINMEKGTISFVYTRGASHKTPVKTLPYTEYLHEMCKAHVRIEDREALHSAMNLEALVQALAQQPLHTTHFHSQDSAGNVRQKRIQCSYIPEARQLVCMVITDITEAARTEQRRNIVLRRALEAAEKSSKAKRSFLTTLSHEIRTPMNTIIGMSEILLDKELAPELARDIGIIQNVGANLLGIINDILVFSRMEPGKPDQNEKSCLPFSRAPAPLPPLPAPIAGIDLERALSTYPRLEIYHDIIKAYGQDIAVRAPQLQQFLEQEDMEAFSVSMHTLKSVSRGVGATALGDAAEKLEALAATGQLAAVKELFPPFMQELENMVGNVGRYIRQYLSTPGSKLPKQPRETFDSATVDALKAACIALDYDLAEVIVDELDMYVYPDTRQELLSRMKKCCVDFDYTELAALTASLS